MKHMKVLFIEARKKTEIDATKTVQEFISSSPHKLRAVCVVASVQYLDLARLIIKEFEKKGIQVISEKGRMSKYENQILGCNAEDFIKIEKRVDAFIVISDGSFHALQLALSSKKPVFQLQSESLKQIDISRLEQARKKRRAALANFLNAKEVGVIISSKPGQCNLSEAIQLKERIEKTGRKAFLFIGNTINISELRIFHANRGSIRHALPLFLTARRLSILKRLRDF